MTRKEFLRVTTTNGREDARQGKKPNPPKPLNLPSLHWMNVEDHNAYMKGYQSAK